jgi:hypothetical protein
LGNPLSVLDENQTQGLFQLRIITDDIPLLADLVLPVRNQRNGFELKVERIGTLDFIVSLYLGLVVY